MSSAFDFYAEVGDVPQAVTVAEYSFPNYPGLETAMAQVINRALKLVPTDSREAGRLLSRYGKDLGMQEGDYEGAQEAFDGALAIARNHDDMVLELRTLSDSFYVNYFHLRFRDLLEKGLRAIELASEVDDLQTEVTMRYWVAASLRHMGDLEGDGSACGGHAGTGGEAGPALFGWSVRFG